MPHSGTRVEIFLSRRGAWFRWRWRCGCPFSIHLGIDRPIRRLESCPSVRGIGRVQLRWRNVWGMWNRYWKMSRIGNAIASGRKFFMTEDSRSSWLPLKQTGLFSESLFNESSICLCKHIPLCMSIYTRRCIHTSSGPFYVFFRTVSVVEFIHERLGDTVVVCNLAWTLTS